MFTSLALSVGSAAAAQNTFWDTELGGAIRGVLVAVGILVVLFALFKAVGHVGQGKMGPAVKIVLAAVVLAAFLFNPLLFGGLIDAFGTLVGYVISSFTDVATA